MGISLKKKLLAELKASMDGKKYSKIIQKKIKALRLQKQIDAAKAANKKEILKELDNREKALSDEVYAQAKGNVANLYKTSLHLMNMVQLAEDIQKSIDISNQQHVDMDLVILNWVKTTTQGGLVTANSIILLNRWVEGLSKSELLNKTGKCSASYISKIADWLAIAGGIISLYITTRETVSLWGHKNTIEKVDACLSLLSSSMLIAGTIASSKVGEFLGRYALLAWFPGVGQLLMILGTVITLIQLGIALYQHIKNQNYLEVHPVGFYFWQEFKELQDSGQSYYDEDYTRPGSQDEEKGYKELLLFHDNQHEYLGQDQAGWGHLSWRAAVPLYLMWRKRDSSDEKLIETIAQMTKVPHVHIDRESTHRNVWVEFEDTIHLLTGEGFIKLYTYLEAAVVSQPKENHYFKANNKSYYEVMSELSEGTYIPQGETDELVKLYEDLETHGYDELDGSGWDRFWRSTSRQNSNQFTHWDHPHFKLQATELGLVESHDH